MFPSYFFTFNIFPSKFNKIPENKVHKAYNYLFSLHRQNLIMDIESGLER